MGTVIGFPLDTIKTRMQTMQANHNIFSMGRFIVEKEGVFALYRGLIPPLISLSTLNTITFTSYSYFRRDVFHASNGWDIRNGLSGLCIAPMCGTISTVENVIKVSQSVWIIHILKVPLLCKGREKLGDHSKLILTHTFAHRSTNNIQINLKY